MATTFKLTDCVADKVAIVAKIGPAHGAQTNPNENPVTKPANKPLPSFLKRDCKGPSTLLIKTSNLEPIAGISMDKPSRPIITVANKRRLLGSMGNILMMVEIKSVKMVKLV